MTDDPREEVVILRKLLQDVVLDAWAWKNICKSIDKDSGIETHINWVSLDKAEEYFQEIEAPLRHGQS